MKYNIPFLLLQKKEGESLLIDKDGLWTVNRFIPNLNFLVKLSLNTYNHTESFLLYLLILLLELSF